MRLKHLFPFLFFCGFLPASLVAQAPDLGVRFGPNIAFFIGDADDLNAASRFYFGIDAILPIGEGNFAIQPELNFLGQGGQRSEDVGGEKYRTNLILNYIQLGGLARYTIVQASPFGVAVFGGVTLDFGTGTRTVFRIAGNRISSDRESFGDANLNAFNVGIALGGEAMYAIGDIVIVFAQLRYGIGLLDIAKDDDFNTRVSSIPILVGARIRLGNL